MMKLGCGSLVGLLVFGLSPASAQFFNRPVTNPLQAPFFNPYNAINPYGSYGSLGLSPYGNGVGANPYGNPGIFGAATGQAVVATTANAGLGDPSMTGHPTRFMDYSAYFFNQGGTATLGTGTPIFGANPTAQSTPAVGVAPPRGKANTKSGS